jgi:hypothetical protein
MNNYKNIIALVAASLACAATSHAAVTPLALTPGGSGSLSGTDYTEIGGTLLTTMVSGPISGGTDTDTLTTKVYSGDTANTLGGLTFVYTVTCAAGDVVGLTVDGFLGSVAVDNYAGTATDAVSARYGTTAGNINFQWATDQGAPKTLIVVVDTSSPVYAQNAANTQDGTAINLTDLAPVPEPTTIVAGALMLLPLGIGAVRSLRKERVS